MRLKINDGRIRLQPCSALCPCLCHDTNGGIQELHAQGFCDGKLNTNSQSDIQQFINERNKEQAK